MRTQRSVSAGNNPRRHHVPKLRAQPGVGLVAVANRTKESGERVAREFGIDWRDLVRASDVDAVSIGTKVSRTRFEDDVRDMEFTEAVARSAAARDQAVEVADL